MKVTEVFKHPGDTAEQRRTRVQALVRPIFYDMIENRPEGAKRILFTEKFDEEGNVYFENGFGTKMPCPDCLEHYYFIKQ